MTYILQIESLLNITMYVHKHLVQEQSFLWTQTFSETPILNLCACERDNEWNSTLLCN